MKPLSQFPRQIARNITTVFADIDDTLTTDGRLPASAYGALEQLYETGFNVAPITGRPAGWCDMIARFWPVSGVVGENGAFYFAYDAKDKKMHRSYFASAKERAANRKKLEEIKAMVLEEVPGCAVSADQAYRDVDLAIDFREDVPPLDNAAVEQIKEICEREGAIAKISSIHVNCWFGEFDKLSMTRRFAGEVLGLDLDRNKDRAVFCGDSPNDAPMFEYFPNSCGVANVLDFKGRMESEPAFIASGKGADGFIEIASMLLRSRS